MAAPTPPPLPARTGGYWTSTQWMVDDVSIGQYGDLTVVDLPEFQLVMGEYGGIETDQQQAAN